LTPFFSDVGTGKGRTSSSIFIRPLEALSPHSERRQQR
jgi:hypothetical protein